MARQGKHWKSGSILRAERTGTGQNFKCKGKKRTEGWPDYGEDLRTQVNKAYPHLEPAARDQMALMHYLSQIDNTQVTFSVKQQRPETLDAAVSATLEMESYLGPKMEVAEVREKPEAVAAALSEESTATMMKNCWIRWIAWKRS